MQQKLNFMKVWSIPIVNIVFNNFPTLIYRLISVFSFNLIPREQNDRKRGTFFILNTINGK